MSAGNKEMRLVLSSDAKPRLRWTSELHQQFVGAVEQLGGAEKATPKSLMRVMGVDGLTLYHLKSHLQKYRMGRSNQNKQENCVEKTSHHSTTKTICDGAKENLQMTRALQMQMEVQRKLHEQIEVQKHLQLRVEAQGKYLQTVLRKAQETICEYGSCSIEAENARAQLAELVSMVDSTCPASELALNDARNEALGHHGSVESSLTSTSEGSTQRYQLQEREEGSLLSLSLRPAKERKRSVDESDRVDHESKRVALVDTIDLNCNDVHSVPRFIDLNS